MGIGWGARGAGGGTREKGWERELGLTCEACMFLIQIKTCIEGKKNNSQLYIQIPCHRHQEVTAMTRCYTPLQVVKVATIEAV